MTFTEGDIVRINVPAEADHGQTVTVIGETTNPIDGIVSVWVLMPQGHAWLYRTHELEAVPTEEKEN